MRYMIVEKDVENKLGFIHNFEYSTIKDAKEYIKVLRKTLSKDYYDIFVAVMEE